MTDDPTSLQVGDTITTAILDEDGRLVGAVRATVIRRLGPTVVEIEYPDGERETLRESG
jgi:hypothetical protein